MMRSLILSLTILFMFAGNTPVFMKEANAQVGKPCCPIGTCFWTCNCKCTYLVESCLNEITAGDQNLTLQTTRSGGVQVEADPAVVEQLVSLRKGKPNLCGTFSLRITGNIESGLTLRCIGFEPHDLKPETLRATVADLDGIEALAKKHQREGTINIPTPPQ